MDKDISNILCTKVDEHAGDWPSESFLELFRIAKKCVEPKMSIRPEIDEVSGRAIVSFFFNALVGEYYWGRGGSQLSTATYMCIHTYTF